MKVIIAGGRDFDDYEKLRTYCDHILEDQTDIEIVSGTAKGADHLGERYAIEKGYKTTRFPADWSKGKSAGYIRNEEMAKYGDALIAFWNGKSKGTGHMIDLAEKYKLKIRIYNYGMDNKN
jgi:hypothetical protein